MNTIALPIRFENKNTDLVNFNDLFQDNLLTSIPIDPVMILSSTAMETNPYVAVMMPLLALATQIKQQDDNKEQTTSDLTVIRTKLLQQINALTELVKNYDIPILKFSIARYMICTVLDELILSTGWGKNSAWGHQSLLSIFHADTHGGEKFFLILTKLMDKPTENLELLEFSYYCLKLGFVGKYKLVPRGIDQIAIIQDELYRCIKRQHSEPKPIITKQSDQKSNNYAIRNKRLKKWLIVIMFTLMLIVFGTFKYQLQQQSSPIITSLSQWHHDISISPLGIKQ